MRIAIVGAGGVGGYLGAMLARAGEEITFLARGANLDALRERGITIQTQTAGTFSVPVAATDAPAAVGNVDLVLVCVKTYDTVVAAGKMGLLIGPETAILTIQNGIDNAERIAAETRAGQVIAAAIYFGGTLEAPGVITKLGGLGGRIVLGDPAGGPRLHAERIAHVFHGAGFEAQVHPNIRIALWEKFLFIVSMGSVCALTRLPIGPLVACAETSQLLRGVVAEGVAVARASGVALSEETVEKTLGMMQRSPPQARPSQYYDIEAGRRLETDAFNGKIVGLGQEYGIPTPLNFALYAALKPFVDGAPALV